MVSATSGASKQPGRQAKPPLIHLPTPPSLPTWDDAAAAAAAASRQERAATPDKVVIPRRPVLERSKSTKRCAVHPYLSGNYAPVTNEHPLTDCLYQGDIPRELAGCQYVRNGGNPMANSETDRDAHWFDADGMLAGVLFRRLEDGTIQPSFLNRYILTDLVLSTPERSRFPLLPSIATLVNPRYSVFFVLLAIMRTVILAFLTWLPGLGLRHDQKLKRIAAANTSIYWHDGKAMAGCESGPPMRIMLPGLETAGWWTGEEELEEALEKAPGDALGGSKKKDRAASKGKGWGAGPPLVGMLREFTTAHPRIDPVSGELLLYHMCFEPPFLRVSVIPASRQGVDPEKSNAQTTKLLGVPVRGLSQPKMMHDFGATRTKTIILDMPLSLDVMNMAKGRPILDYDPTKPSRFGIFPRHRPEQVRWFESPEACCVFHTANSWDGEEDSVNMLACRLNSATLVYSAGNLLPPSHVLPPANCPEKCQLYYWRFQAKPDEVSDISMAATGRDKSKNKRAEKINVISHEFALSDIPLEFPSINEEHALQETRYVYGTSLKDGTFDAGLAKAAKIDCLVKVDAETLIRKGKQRWAQGKLKRGESVDTRTVVEVLAQQREVGSAGGSVSDPIQVFEMPSGWYAQEATFVPRQSQDGTPLDEDDGWLVFYAFDERTGLHPTSGEVLPGATSELWIIDAKTMRDLVCRIKLPQRVPYGLHGNLFSEKQIASQRPVPASQIRSWADSINNVDPFSSSSPTASFDGTMPDLKLLPVSKGVRDAFARHPLRATSWWLKRTIEGWIA